MDKKLCESAIDHLWILVLLITVTALFREKHR